MQNAFEMKCKYISNSIDSGKYGILLFSLIIQFLIILYFYVFFIFFIFFDYDENENEKSKSRVTLIIFNIINFVMQFFPFPLNFINIMIFLKLFNSDNNLSIYLHLFNIFNMIIFTLTFVTYTCLYNDTTALDNNYFPSVSNPTFNFLTFFKFFIYNMIILSINFLPSFLILIYLLAFYLF